MSLRLKAPLRHPTLKTVLLPWLDSRQVSIGTICEYLETDYDGVTRLGREGAFAGPGCTFPEPVDGKRPPGRTTTYCPAAIWAFNRWEPAPQVIALLLTADRVWAGYAEQLAAITARATGRSPSDDTPPRHALRVVGAAEA